MTRKLKEEDRAAVDLLLDRSVASAAEGFAAPLKANGRVRAASNVMSLLDALPASDPPKDLVARTMRRIDRAVAIMPSESPSHSPYVNRHHPLM